MITDLKAQVSRVLDNATSATPKTIEDVIRHPLPLPCSPLEIYCLVALLRHERRQKWVGYIVESRLRANGSELGRYGAFGHPDSIPQKGDVPGEAGWTYFFHGRGCCFSNTDGTVIDVDFADDGSALEIDTYFYDNFLEGAPELDWSERQLKHPEGLSDAWHYELPLLVAKGYIEKEHRCRITDSGRTLAEAMEPLIERLNKAPPLERCYLLSAMSDQILAQAEAHRGEFAVPTLSDAARRQMASRADMLRGTLQATSGYAATPALAALVRLLGVHALPEVRSALWHQPVSGLNHTAFAALKSWPTAESTQLMRDAFLHLTARSDRGLLARLSGRNVSAPDRGSPWCSLVVYLGRELLIRHLSSGLPSTLRPDLVRALGENYGAMDDEAAFLLFLLDEAAGRQKLARCLTHPIPRPRQGAAVFLAMIADEACIEILAQASAGPADGGGHEAACALSLLDHPKARAAAEMWRRKMDGYEEAEGKETTIFGKTIRTWSLAEIRRSNLREQVLYDYEQRQKQYGMLLSLRGGLKGK